jgi:membrane associated rhomboid family serine protease
MTAAAVGLRCPEHSGKPQGVARVKTGVRRAGFEGTGAMVTKGLIAVNVLVFLVNLGQGASLGSNGGELYVDWLLIGIAQLFDGTMIGVADGEWWRLLSAAFLHGNVLHIGMNMLMLWWIGGPMEAALGRGRYLAVYLVSALSGSAGALVLSSPNQATVGASGAIFGILGAALVLERQRHYVLGGSALSIILLNLILTFAVPGISVGGHVGGLAGGALSALALARFGRGHALYGRLGIVGLAGMAGVAVLSIAVAYLRVQSYS